MCGNVLKGSYTNICKIMDVMTDSNRLEQVHLNAARIVTGLPIFASLQSLYQETGWETLAERRKNRKLILMYKIINNDTPNYLTELLPKTIGDTSTHNLRNSSNFVIPFTRLFSFQSSFFPTALKLWNDRISELRNSPSLSQFKSRLRGIRTDNKDFLLFGERKNNILLTRLRHRCSCLNADLFHTNIIPNARCSCGADFETAEHFFFECILYNDLRQTLMQYLNANIVPNLDTLTNLCTEEEIMQTILAVLRYIKDTQRFQ